MSIKNFFSEPQKLSIKEAIGVAETNTSGEVRVHMEATCSGDPYQRAVKVFEKLNMHKTALRNGVIIYISIDDRKLAIAGDKGINDIVPKDFWQHVIDEMRLDFAKQEFDKGLVKVIHQVGEKLKTFFPYQSDDINELSDDISFEDDLKDK